VKEYIEQLDSLVKAMPAGATNASVSWNDDEYNYSISVYVQDIGTGNWQISLTKYKYLKPATNV